MLRRDKEELLDGLAQYGYPLVSPASQEKPESLLNHLAEEKDTRLLEGFPVVLANAMKKHLKLDWEKNDFSSAKFKSNPNYERFVCLLVLSYLLFKLYGLESKRLERAEALVDRFDPQHKMLNAVYQNFMESKPVDCAGLTFSPERFKSAFLDYVVHSSEDEALEKKQHDLRLELLLSELFTANQKKLMRKKMAGESLSKTEQEYFSRVVKKRLKALASPELHQMARQVLG